MQGDVSRIGGTEAGVLPKYKNDIKKYLLFNCNYLSSLFITSMILCIAFLYTKLNLKPWMFKHQICYKDFYNKAKM